MQTIDFIDSHTGGEPTRVITRGAPDLGHGSMRERLQRLRTEHDDWRRSVVLEPRGSDALVGALLLEPQSVDAAAGVIFFNNVGYLGMCGHGTIGLVRTLQHMGRITRGRFQIETPVGNVSAELRADNRVTIDNVESWRFAKATALDVPSYGRIHGDIAWGGNWFFITKNCPYPVDPSHLRELTAYAEAVRHALERNDVCGADGATIDHIEISAPPTADDTDSRNFVLCPGMAYDRSPCGTGTSAKVACLAADDLLEPGQPWRQAGVLGTVFEASYQPGTTGVMPRITGSAWVTGQGQLLIDDTDPLAQGIDT